MRQAEIMPLPRGPKSEVDTNDEPEPTDGQIIILRLPSKFHQGSDDADPRSKRYDLSGSNLSNTDITQLAMAMDPYQQAGHARLDETVDAAWHYASNSIQVGQPVNEVVSIIQEFLDDAANYYGIELPLH